MIEGTVVKVVSGHRPQLTRGSAGLMTQIPGAMASVSNLANATGGMKPGNFTEPALDRGISTLKNKK